MAVRFDTVTLFPAMFEAVTAAGVSGRAVEAGIWSLKCWNPRDFTDNPYRTVDDRDAAFAHKGWLIAVPRSAFPASGEDEYYWTDLIGLTVRNREGVELGRVSDLLDLGPHQVLKVRQGDKECLIPFVAQYIERVDLEGRVVRVDWGLDY